MLALRWVAGFFKMMFSFGPRKPKRAEEVWQYLASLPPSGIFSGHVRHALMIESSELNQIIEYLERLGRLEVVARNDGSRPNLDFAMLIPIGVSDEPPARPRLSVGFMDR